MIEVTDTFDDLAAAVKAFNARQDAKGPCQFDENGHCAEHDSRQVTLEEAYKSTYVELRVRRLAELRGELMAVNILGGSAAVSAAIQAEIDFLNKQGMVFFNEIDVAVREESAGKARPSTAS